FFARDTFQDAFSLQTRMRFDGQHGHADAIFAGSRKSEAEFRALSRKERVWDLDENARAITGFGIAATCAAMRQVDQNLNALDDYVVRFLTLDAGDEADAAGVVLEAGVVEALRGR